MKRKLLFTLALVATACGMISCSNDEVASSLSQGSTPIDTTHCLKFLTEGQRLTRVSYILGHTAAGLGATPYWQPNDRIWLYVGDEERVGSIGSDITALTQRAKFYFPPLQNRSTYKVHYLGNATDGRYITIGANQWQYPPDNTDHLASNGDCAEGLATQDANNPDLYTVKFKRLPAYLCIMPYCSDEFVRTGAVLKGIRIYSDNPIRGKFDVARYGFTNGTDVANNIEMILNGGNGFPLDNAAADRAKNAVYVVIGPSWHNLVIEINFTSPKFPGQELRAVRVIGNHEYKANSMTDIIADVANYYDADNNPIGAGGQIELAKKHKAVEVSENEDWDGTFNR